MDKKNVIRKQFISKRSKYYYDVDIKFFHPLIKFFKKKIKKKNAKISLYYPSSFELDILKIVDIEYFQKFKFLLPIVEDDKTINFYSWKQTDILFVNRYGILEPYKSKIIIPDIILVPLVAFDKNKNRLGYGKGYYDRYLKKHSKLRKKIITVGVAFSFQKHHNLPVNKKDFKLDYIITENGFIK